jgi:hypothetical protein
VNSSNSIRMQGSEAARPSPWLALAALLAAPLAATIVEAVIFDIGATAWGYSPESVSLQGLAFVYFGFALVFIPLGGLLILIFWRKALFGPLLSTTVGAILGALVGYISILVLPLPDEDYPDIFATIGLGVTSGVAWGLTIWLICRLGWRRHD